MTEFNKARLYSFLQVVLVPVSIIYILVYIYVAVTRMYYPFELSSIESGISSVVARILSGKPIYTEPSLEYVPFIYTPLYYFLTSIIARITGPGFAALRVVSFTSGILCLALIYLFVKHDTKSRFLGLVSAGLFAAFYNISQGWFDIGGNDTLNLLLLLSALYIIRFYRNNKSYLAGGVLLFLAFFTRQYSIIVILFVLAYGLIYNRKIILPILVTTVPLIVLSILLMDRIYDNWFSFYVFSLPMGRGISTSSIILFWTEGLLKACILPIGFILGNMVLNFQSVMKNSSWGFNLFAGAGMILLSWVTQLNMGAQPGAYLPAYAMIIIIFGISANEILMKFTISTEGKGNRLPKVVYVIMLLQFLSLIYDPRWLIPSQEDKNAGREFVDNISGIEGDVFIPSHGYLAVMAGKKQFAQASAIADLLDAGDTGPALKLREEISQAFADKKFAAVVYDDFSSPIENLDSDGNYVFEKIMLDDSRVFSPITGTPSGPRYYFALKNPPLDEFPPFEMIGPMPLALGE